MGARSIPDFSVPPPPNFVLLDGSPGLGEESCMPDAGSKHAHASELERARYAEGLEVVDLLARQLKKTAGAALDEDDLRSAGQEALVHAARSFDPSLGVPFRRWANLRVKGAMFDAIRARGGIPRRLYRELRAREASLRVEEVQVEEGATQAPTTPEDADRLLGENLAASAMAMALSFLKMGGSDDTLLAKDEAPSAEEALSRAELEARLRALVLEQPEAERTLLQKHYFEDCTLEEAGRSLGLSKSWASRLHARAIANLAAAAKRSLF